MNYVNLSIKELQNESLKLARQIDQSFKPDIVIYIAKGGYLIGKIIADFFNVPCVGIHAERKGNSVKDILAPLLRLFPKWLTKLLRQIELKSGVHKVVKERRVFFDIIDIKAVDMKGRKNILIVDDSVDTGYSMKNVLENIKLTFRGKVYVKTAAINVWSKSFSVFRVDFYRYKDTIIETPMSKDSKDYPALLESDTKRHNYCEKA